MKNIGMIVAVEMDSVRKRYGRPAGETLAGGFQISRYALSGCTLHVLNSGIGELAAAAAAQLLIDRFGVELIVNFGVVGGLTEEMAGARTCVVEKLVHYDFDLSGIDPVKPGQYPGYEDEFIPLDPALVALALAAEPGLRKVTCASADKFIGSGEAKKRLHEKFGAEICEMEAAGIALTCRRNQIPCLCVKTVADGINGGADAYYKELQRSSEICLEITEKIMEKL